MGSNAENAKAILDASIGAEPVAGDWMNVTQERINAFAEVTEDRQFIHVDPELSAKMSPYGVTIAHGFLTLSLLTPLVASIPQDTTTLTGIVAGVNYGFEKVRFISPVKVNSNIRATQTLANVELKGNALQVTRTCTVEIEGEAKPALVADWITRLVYS